MSDKSRRLLTLSALAIAAQLAAAGTQAQTPDATRPSDTSTDRHAMPAPDRTAMKNVTPQEFAKQAAVIGR